MKDIEKLLGLNTDRFINPMIKEIGKLSSLDKRITSFLPSHLSTLIVEKQRNEYLNSYSGLYKYLPQSFYRQTFQYNDFLKKNDIFLHNFYPFKNSNYDFYASYRSDYTKQFGTLINNLNNSFIPLPNSFSIINSFSKAMSLTPIFSEYPNLLKFYNNSFLTDNLIKWTRYSKLSEDIFSQDYYQSLDSDLEVKISFSDLDELSIIANDYKFEIDDSGNIITEDSSISFESFMEISNEIFKLEKKSDNVESAINLLISKVHNLDGNLNTPFWKSVLTNFLVGVVLLYFSPVFPVINLNLLKPNHDISKQLLKETQKLDLDKTNIKDYKFVNNQDMKIMTKKSKNSHILASLYYGSFVKVILKKKNWSYVQYEDSMGFMVEGWVFSRYLQNIE